MAKPKKSVASVAEVNFAKYFLKLVKADVTNILLVTAVVAWLRVMTKGKGIFNAKGNNPFNLTKTEFITFPWGGGGYTQTTKLTFKNEYLAAQAAAKLINQGKSIGGYSLIKAALRRKTSGTDKAFTEQAADFIMALSMSKWDINHFGYKSSQGLASSAVYQAWVAITQVASPPVKTTTQPEAVEEEPKPRPANDPNYRPYSGTTWEYLDPYAARAFYNAKHRKGWDAGNLPSPDGRDALV